MVIILILKVIVIIIIIITIIIFIIIIEIIIISLITWCLEINIQVKIFENTKGVSKKHEPQAFRLSFPTKLIEIANFTIRINQPLLVESKAFDWYIFSLYNVVYCEIIDWLKSLRESELWPVCWYCKLSSISSSHRYVQSNLAISNSVNSKSPSPRYFEGRSNALGFTLPLYASPVISKPHYFELFFISLGTSK